MTFATGSLIRAREREWVVLPPDTLCDNDPNLQWILVKPLYGSEEEIVCLSAQRDHIDPAVFPLPDPNSLGDATSCALLRDAVRLGIRANTGPFRSFGRLGIAPHPYQLVPLLMAMKQDIIRLLIADDVGIGKTIEALMIVKELLDRGEIKRVSVLCPPQLAEQWQNEMIDKFHLDAELILPSTVSRLEKAIEQEYGVGKSLFEALPLTVVSLDYIKNEKHRVEFLRTCPEMVIVDEAHSCASGIGHTGKLSYDLVKTLASDLSRNMIFVTATPHTGKNDVFRSLLGMLRPDFQNLPDDLSGKLHEGERKDLAKYFIQRRRGDIKQFLEENTPFPIRKSAEYPWRASKEWNALFKQAFSLVQGILQEEGITSRQQRVRLWAAIALMRAIASSPAAAEASLKTKSGFQEESETLEEQRETSEEQIDELGRQTSLDLDIADDSLPLDNTPGVDFISSGKPLTHEEQLFQKSFLELAQKANTLQGLEKDDKLKECLKILKTKVLKEGYAPVIFCRFIKTAQYLATQLRQAFSEKEFPEGSIEWVTGDLHPQEREDRVNHLADFPKRILVCTDCLSEGINLQQSFNAVIHYDLSWNPTRHEQREGRVDRLGQPSPEVKTITLYGDNPMDGMVLKVLLRKHLTIRKDLGISVPVPANSTELMQALIQGLFLQRDVQPEQLLFLSTLEHTRKKVDQEWNKTVDAEKRSRTLFAQQSFKTEEVAQELQDVEKACGERNVEAFVSKGLHLLGVSEEIQGNVHIFTIDQQLQDRYPWLSVFGDQERKQSKKAKKSKEQEAERLYAVFQEPCQPDQTLLLRTHPLVENLATYLAGAALTMSEHDAIHWKYARCGAMRTKAVRSTTTLLLCRFRFELTTTIDLTPTTQKEHSILTEECQLLAYEGIGDTKTWLDSDKAQELSQAKPDQNVSSEQAKHWVQRAIDTLPQLQDALHKVMKDRAKVLLDSHRRIRNAAGKKGIRYTVVPKGEFPDILGVYILLPVNN